jgi:hypothetical protein
VNRMTSRVRFAHAVPDQAPTSSRLTPRTLAKAPAPRRFGRTRDRQVQLHRTPTLIRNSSHVLRRSIARIGALIIEIDRNLSDPDECGWVQTGYIPYTSRRGHPLHICQLSEDIPYTQEMPWQTTDAMKERVKFVSEWEKRWQVGEGRLNFAELCRESESAVQSAMSGCAAIGCRTRMCRASTRARVAR